MVKLSAKLIEAFSGTFLSPRYDDPKPTPAWHRAGWELYASDSARVGCVAPRDHAKSTALTFDYILAEMCFRTSDYCILIGSTEDKASEQLSNISEELHENTDLRSEFGIQTFEVDQKTEIIIRCDDSHRFRILARGAEQKIRGSMWKGKRPNLIVCDDMEDDEQVESRDRRIKFRKWFFRAVMQAKSLNGKVRVHGTILHEDSLLARLRKNRMWNFLFFKAHESYSDFSNLLWPERWSASALKNRQIEFEDDGDAAGYAQEFLNNPLDHADTYLKSTDFIEMSDEDYDSEKRICIGADFAVSKADKANRTSFTIAGQDRQNIINILDEQVDRWDTLEWMNKIFELHEEWRPDYWFVEDGVIWKSVWPMLSKEMQRRDIWINFYPLPSVKDKATRGRTLQKRMRAKGVHFNKNAEWYPGYEEELLRFTTGAQASLDDQFDSTVEVMRGFDILADLDDDDDMASEEEDAEMEELYRQKMLSPEMSGRSSVTGY